MKQGTLGDALSLLKTYGIGLALLAEVIIFSQYSEYFLTAENILNVSLQISITAILAAGMTFVILTAGIDLSVGALLAFSGIVVASILKLPLPFAATLLLSIGACILLGIVSGYITGLLVTRLHITPFIVTLSLMTIWRGAAFLYTDGRPIWGLPEEFSIVGSGRFLTFPIPTILMVCVYGLSYVVLKYTTFGRYIYAVGGNKEAAYLAGINTKKIITSVYIISGILSAISGMVLASRVNSGQPNAGLMYELDVIAAVVVGGASLFGGRGSIIGTLLGALLIGVLRNGLNLLNVGSYAQMIIVGIVILLAVMMDQTRKKT